MKNYLSQMLTLSIVCGTLSPIAIAQPTSFDTTVASATRINAANALVRDGKASEAIAEYQQVQANDADRDQLNYNLGVAEYRAGDIDSAKAHFSESAASSLSPVAARSRYNLGNCFYTEAIKLSADDRPAAIAALREAIEHYRGSLAADANITDARANIELATRLLKKLQDEQKQEEDQKRAKEKQNQQQQDQQQPAQQENAKQENDQQPQDQDKQNQEQQAQGQQQQAQQNQSKNSAQPQSSEEQGRSDEQQGEQPAQDQAGGELDKSASDAAQSHSPQASNPQEQGSQPQPMENPPSAESPESTPQSPPIKESPPIKPSPSNEPRRAASGTDQELVGEQAEAQPQAEEQAGEQAIPAGDLTASGENQAADNAKGHVGIVDPMREDGLITKEEALKMLQSVRDRDMLRRMQRERLERSRYIPTDRNW